MKNKLKTFPVYWIIQNNKITKKAPLLWAFIIRKIENYFSLLFHFSFNAASISLPSPRGIAFADDRIVRSAAFTFSLLLHGR
jgi:hypothetical protein